jgi:hypothetical protein
VRPTVLVARKINRLMLSPSGPQTHFTFEVYVPMCYCCSSNKARKSLHKIRPAQLTPYPSVLSLFTLSQFQPSVPSSLKLSLEQRRSRRLCLPLCTTVVVAFVCRWRSNDAAPFAARLRPAASIGFVDQSELHAAFLARSLRGAPKQLPPSSLPRGQTRHTSGGTTKFPRHPSSKFPRHYLHISQIGR